MRAFTRDISPRSSPRSSSGACGNSGLGDPEVIYISPIEQAIKRIGFYRNNRESITINYLTLIIPTAGVPSLTIDGAGAFTHTYAHPNLPGQQVLPKRLRPDADRGNDANAGDNDSSHGEGGL